MGLELFFKMPTFRYKAYNSAGKTIAGDIEAIGLKDAADRLKKTGLFPVEVTESVAGGGGVAARLGYTGIGSESVALVTRQLSTLLSAGTPLAEALGVLAENVASPALKSVIIKIREDVTGGSSLAAALGAHPRVFSNFYQGLVASGEATGALDGVLARLADYLEARTRIVRDLWTALTYPILMCVVGMGVLSFLFIFVIPKITRIFEDTETVLPWITVVLLWITGAFRSYWPLLLLVIGGGLLAANRYWGNPRLKAAKDRFVLRAPWFGRLATGFYISNMARTLGNLLRGGVPLIKALDITKDVLNNTVYDRILLGAEEDCTGGGSLSASLRKHPEVPPLVAHMVSVGEKSGNLDEMLIKAADSYETEFNNSLKRAVSLAEPLLILVMGVVIGFIVLAILLPIFQLNQVIR